MSRIDFRRNAAVLGAAIFLVVFGFFSFYVYARSLRVLSYDRLVDRYQMGLHGVRMHVDDATDSFDPWEPLEQNRSLNAMLEKSCERLQKNAECYRESNVWFETFLKKHTVSIAGAEVTLVRGAEPISESEVSEERIEEAMRLMLEWVAQNQSSDGFIPYSYAPSRGTYGESDNVIRQMITVQGLYAMGRSLRSEEAIEASRLAEKAILSRYLIDLGTTAYMQEDGEVKLGAAALTILALREKHPDEVPSRLERALAQHLLSQQRDDGSFQTFLQEEWTDTNDRFYSGEALTALAKMYGATKDVSYLNALSLALPHYREKLAREFYPQYAPWHMQAYAIAYSYDPREEFATYVYWLADALIQGMLEEDTGALPDEKGRFYNPNKPEWGPPHSSSTGIYTEGLTYAYELAVARGDLEHAARYKAAIISGARSLLQVQWTPVTAYYLTYPERVVGSLKRTPTDNRLRIDQMGHAANALARVYDVVISPESETPGTER